MHLRDKEMTEWVSLRVPYGATGLMNDIADRMKISRSELMRRALAAFLVETEKGNAAQ